MLSVVERWLSQNESVGIATVVDTWGSSPRGTGAKMAFTASGKMAGSVSGGCVEGQVFELGVQSLRTGHPQLLHFGVSDETAFEVGLACGGSIDVFVSSLDPEFFQELSKEIKAFHSLAIVTVVGGPEELLGRGLFVTEDGTVTGRIGAGLDDIAIEYAREGLRGNESKNVSCVGVENCSVRFFIDLLLPPPTLVMVGGVHIAIALSAFAKLLGYRTMIIDPRRAFGNPERFPHVDQLIQAWPQDAFQQINLNRNTCVAMLTHDPKIDDPALIIVLDSPAFYIGALGSRKTHESRRKRLLEEGVNEAHLDRLHAPIGMDLGAKTPEEIALSIIAEIVAVRHRRAS